MMGSTYQWGPDLVHLCIFGSWSNLEGTYSTHAGERLWGWYTSTNVGVENLLNLVTTVEDSAAIPLPTDDIPDGNCSPPRVFERGGLRFAGVLWSWPVSSWPVELCGWWCVLGACLAESSMKRVRILVN